MTFEIMPSKYFPETYSNNLLWDYLKENQYSIERKDGEKYLVTYSDYITSFSTEGNGGLFISPFLYPGQGQSVSIGVIRQLPPSNDQSDIAWYNPKKLLEIGNKINEFAFDQISKFNGFDPNSDKWYEENFKMNFQSGVLNQQVDGDESGFFMIVANTKTLQNFGCLDISKGVKSNDN